MMAFVVLLMTAMATRIRYIMIDFIRMTKAVSGGHGTRNLCNVGITVSTEITIPFKTCGLRKHYIINPKRRLDPKTLTIVIGHEFQHIR